MSKVDPHSFRWPNGTVVEPDGTIVLRPSWANFRSRFLQLPAVAVVGMSLGARRLSSPAVAIAIFFGVTAVCVVALVVYFRRARTSIGPRGLVRRDLLRDTFIPAERIGLVIHASDLRNPDPRVDSTLIVTETDGRRVAMFNGPYWTREQMRAMALALGRTTWEPSGQVTFADIKDRYPRAVPTMHAHPYLFAFALVGVLIAAGIAVAITIAAVG